MKGNASAFKYLKAKERLKVLHASVYGWQKIYQSRFQLNRVTYQRIRAIQDVKLNTYFLIPEMV